jgi:hypothetical protein
MFPFGSMASLFNLIPRLESPSPGDRTSSFFRFLPPSSVQTLDSDGRAVEHVDLHSLRRTFATNLIAGGADPKSVSTLRRAAILEPFAEVDCVQEVPNSVDRKNRKVLNGNDSSARFGSPIAVILWA